VGPARGDGAELRGHGPDGGWYPISYAMHDVTGSSSGGAALAGAGRGQAGGAEVEPVDDGVRRRVWRRRRLSPQSTQGSYHGGAWTADAADSPGIDAGSLADAFANETVPNGGR